MYIILFCIQLFFIIFSHELSSSTIHLLVIGDEYGATRSSVTQDLRRINAIGNQLPQATNMNLNRQKMLTKDLSSKAILQWIKKTEVKQDDVFIFYFSGHGFRSAKKSKWPAIHISRTNELLNLEKVINGVTKKQARLSLIFCDACNVPVNQAKSKMAPSRSSSSHTFSQQEKKGLHQLFVKAKGSIIACGARPNTLAWGSSGGGLFTAIFSMQLQKEIKKASPSWKHLFSTTKKLCIHVQQPVIQLKI